LKAEKLYHLLKE